MAFLIGRRAIVTIDTLRIEGLDVKFSVELDAKVYGKAEISVYNLNAKHRKSLEDSKSPSVELLVGYQGQQLDRIFKGVLRDVFSQKDGTDWVSTLKTGDGDTAGTVRFNKAYPKGVKTQKVWADMVDEFRKSGFGIGNAIKAFEKGGLANAVEEFSNGFTGQGSAMNAIRKLGQSAGLDVSVQDGELLVTPIGQALETTAIVLGRTSGLVGSPQGGTKGEVKARALILPGLRPKRKVELRSNLIKGLFVVERVKYQGDTSDNDWYADLVLKGI